MYMYIKGIEFASLYDASIDFGNVRITCVYLMALSIKYIFTVSDGVLKNKLSIIR